MARISGLFFCLKVMKQMKNRFDFLKRDENRRYNENGEGGIVMTLNLNERIYYYFNEISSK